MRRFALMIAGALALSGCAGDELAADEMASVSPEQERSPLPPEEQYAEEHNVTLGPVEVVREVDPEEQMVLLHQCLVDDGWPATLDREGNVSVMFPPEQEQAYNTSSARCRMQYPLEEKYTQPFGAHEYGLLYDHLVEHTLPCLEGLGYSPKQPPSRQTNIDENVMEAPTSYILSEGVYDDIYADVERGRWPSVNHVLKTVCPESPPEGLLYPGQ